MACFCGLSCACGWLWHWQVASSGRLEMSLCPVGRGPPCTHCWQSDCPSESANSAASLQFEGGLVLPDRTCTCHVATAMGNVWMHRLHRPSSRCSDVDLLTRLALLPMLLLLMQHILQTEHGACVVCRMACRPSAGRASLPLCRTRAKRGPLTSILSYSPPTTLILERMPSIRQQGDDAQKVLSSTVNSAFSAQGTVQNEAIM